MEEKSNSKSGQATGEGGVSPLTSCAYVMKKCPWILTADET